MTELEPLSADSTGPLGADSAVDVPGRHDMDVADGRGALVLLLQPDGVTA